MTPTLVADFFVPGLPQPGGSKRAFYNPKIGRAIITDANPKAKGWQGCVKEFARDPRSHSLTDLLDGALAAEVTFFMPRPKGHFGKRGLLSSAPAYPISKPDATKLWRSTEDALTGVLWRDDARIVLQLVRKVYAEDGKTGARVKVWSLARSENGRETVGIRSAEEVLVQGGLF